MADDTGFSDLGCYGSEIETPAIDRLAAGGMRFTQFYNTGRCWPTRASLMTGHYPHQARRATNYGLEVGWSNVANTPFRFHEIWVHEGGTATPLVVHWPGGTKAHEPS